MKPPVEAPTSSAWRPPTSSAQGVERVGELDAAARDVGRRPGDVELDLGVDELAWLLRPPAARPEVDLAGDHGGRGARAGLEQAALRQQGVQAHAGHGQKGTGRHSSLPHSRPMDTLMRPVLASVLVLLALPASASAQSTLPPLDYAGPTASISRGAPLTFAVRTAAPGGSVNVRVSGSDDGRRRRPADRPGGHLARRDRHAERPTACRSGPSRRTRCCASVPVTTTGRPT